MTYNLRHVFREVDGLLSLRPTMRLASLSKDLGTERHTIERAVRAVTGLSFRQYRGEKLHEVASRLVTENANLPLKALAAKLGYSSQFTFSRAVKKATGLSPTEIKRRLD